MTYDHWKTTEPDSGGEPLEKPVYTESDVDKITQDLRAENARLREALRALVARIDASRPWYGVLEPELTAARAALAGTKSEHSDNSPDEISDWRAHVREETSQRYVIAWRSRLSGVTDCTTSAFTHAEAEKICQSMNRQNHTVYHWPKEVAEDRSKPALTPSPNGA